MVNKNIAVVGLWHLGCIYSTSLAKMGFKVVGFDVNKKIVNNLNKGIPPIFEPELEEILNKHLNKNLKFSILGKDLKNKDYIFITHDVEIDDNDTVQLSTVNKLLQIVTKNASEDTVIVISSQLPVGTGRNLMNSMKKNGILNPKVIYFPENLRLGQAYSSFLRPDRIILGSDNVLILERFKKDFDFNSKVITMGLESAEMVKHALNSYLALCISFSSELSDLSEKTRANMIDVVKALKSDKRVSPFAPLAPGLGFSGGTLGRDVQSLRKIGKNLGQTTKLLDAIYDVNSDRLPMLVKKINTKLPTLKGKTIGILGLTYKANTNTLRRSTSLELSKLLKKKGCNIKAYDPVIKNEIKDFSFIKVCSSYNDFFKNLDMVVLMTEWPEFKEIEPKTVAPLMKSAIVVDTKNFLNESEYKGSGFTYIGIGMQ